MSWSEPVLIKLEQTFNIVVLQKLLNQLQISKPKKKVNFEKNNASTYFKKLPRSNHSMYGVHLVFLVFRHRVHADAVNSQKIGRQNNNLS